MLFFLYLRSSNEICKRNKRRHCSGKKVRSHFCPEGKRDIWISLDENRDINRLLRAWINIYLAAFLFLFVCVFSVHIGHIYVPLSNLDILVLSNVCSANVPFHAIFRHWWRKAAFYLFSDEKSGETKQQPLYPITENRCENA